MRPVKIPVMAIAGYVATSACLWLNMFIMIIQNIVAMVNWLPWQRHAMVLARLVMDMSEVFVLGNVF